MDLTRRDFKRKKTRQIALKHTVHANQQFLHEKKNKKNTIPSHIIQEKIREAKTLW